MKIKNTKLYSQEAKHNSWEKTKTKHHTKKHQSRVIRKKFKGEAESQKEEESSKVTEENKRQKGISWIWNKIMFSPDPGFQVI